MRKKSCCIRIGPRCDTVCACITTTDGHKLSWVKEIRYLGVHITQSRKFRCSLNHAKQSFYRSINAIFGKICRTASGEVILELVKSKCLPIFDVPIAIGWTSVCPSVCLSVTRWYCVKTAQPIVKLSSLFGSPMILVF